MGIDVHFPYENDCNSFVKLLDLKKYKYGNICKSGLQDNKNFDLLFKAADNEKDRDIIKKFVPNSHKVSMDTDQANKFIKNTLEIKIDSVEQLGNTAAAKAA